MWRLAILLFFLMQSCYVTKTIYTRNVFNSWLGASAQELIMQQGRPTRVVSDGKDGNVFVYDNSFVTNKAYSSTGEFYTWPSGSAVPGHQPSSLYYQPGSSVSNQFVVTKKVEYFVNKLARSAE